ncbi:lipid-A-disaccharide synthase [Marinagarivorans algicola]|uniref:lipid-A-disaccharide synthase n=1 Tax=Marinagarivorans algicola TaxID=1513270 RepID=UPI0006B94A42|nr:lipid-A-disaccharide synthase [Marinagarivorans algicola]
MLEAPLVVTGERRLRVGIVVGEASGDILGAGLIRAIQYHHPNAIIEGIAGPLMLEQGATSFFPQDRLAVMGFVEPLKRLPELLRIRKFLKQHFIANPPDVFIGIDSPDFTLDLELALKNAGIKTVHYVSPSVWAWRQNRVKKIAKAVDVMLTLFPFEQEFYLQRNIKAICVGHTLADQIPLQPNTEQARVELGLEIPATHQVLAILPGSRAGEVERMLPVFLESAILCLQQNPHLCLVIPAASEARQQQIENILQRFPRLPIRVFLKHSHAVMQASDAVVMASGTTTLEAMLLKKPMVIAYKVAALSYFIFARMVKVKFIGLPNLLAQKELAKEFIQQAAVAENIAPQILKILNKHEQASLQQEYLKLHKMLKLNASEKAAQAVLNLIDQPVKSIH